MLKFDELQKLTDDLKSDLVNIVNATPNIELSDLLCLFVGSRKYIRHVDELEFQISQYGPDTLAKELLEMASSVKWRLTKNHNIYSRIC